MKATDNIPVGTFVVVGGSCIQDFIPGTLEAQLSGFEITLSAMDLGSDFGSEGGGGGCSRFGVSHYLAFVAAHLREGGWLSRTAARAQDRSATADDAFGTMIAVAEGKDVKPEYKPTASDYARVAADLAFLDTYLETHGEDNDYLHNILVVLKVGTTDFRTAGITASALVTAEREMGKEIERRKYSNLKATSRYLGEVKGKLLGVPATVTGTMEREGNYGVTTMVKFVTADGCALTWWASGSVSADWEVGKEYLLAATVKKHEEYQGLKQTVVTRVVAVTPEIVAAETAKAEKKAARDARKAAKSAAGSQA